MFFGPYNEPPAKFWLKNRKFLAQSPTTIENCVFSIFFQVCPLDTSNASFFDDHDQKNTIYYKVKNYCSKSGKDEKVYQFHQEFFMFLRLLWRRKKQFWQPCQQFFVNVPKTFEQWQRRGWISFFHKNFSPK